MVNNEEIARRRKELGLSMADAATLAGFKAGRQQWNEIEKGRNSNPNLATLLGMARALRCSIVKLVVQDHLKR